MINALLRSAGGLRTGRSRQTPTQSVLLKVRFVLLAATTILVAVSAAAAQTYTILHNFTNGQDGNGPDTSLSLDAAGNMYGTAGGGSTSYGLAFRMTKRNDSWLFTRLYAFLGGDDGISPNNTIRIAPNGVLYGTTVQGGQYGGGTVYELRPPSSFPRSAQSPWSHNVLYSFGSGHDGTYPQGELTLDSAGNIYGTAELDGPGGNGMTYELAFSNGAWNRTVLFSPGGYQLAGQILGGVVFDQAGNLYGVMENGGDVDLGEIYELSPNGGGWTAQVLYSFDSSVNGTNPMGGFDHRCCR